MSKITTAALIAALSLTVGGQASAQEMIDPLTKIKKIMDGVAEEMQEVDRLLLESARDGDKTGAAASSLARSVEQINELLDQTSASQGKIISGLDELMEEMRQSGA